MNERNIAKYAWRNLWRNRRRTLITLSSIAFGLLLAILFTGLGDRTYSEMIDLAARMGGGHVTIQHREFRDNPTIQKRVADVDALAKLAASTPGVTLAVPRMTGYTLLATAKQSVGAYFLGIDPDVETQETLFALSAIKEGALFSKDDKQSIVIGKKLASNLDISLGSKVVYTLTDTNGEMVTGLGRVSGLIETGADAFDAAFCLLPINTLRTVLGYKDTEAGQVALFISDQRQAESVAASLNRKLSGTDTALPWFDTNPELAGFISMKVSGATFFEIIIMVLIAAGIFNTLFVSVMERVREFGIMMAIGFSPGQLFRMVMWESLWLSIVGLFLGGVITLWPYHYLATTGVDLSHMVGKDGSEVAGVVVDPIMNVGIFPEHALLIALAAVLATLLSGIYPAWKAGKVVPVASIKLV